MWGYARSALASERAAELRPTYAPELNFIGAAIGSVTPSVISVLNTVNGGEHAGLIPAAILGLTNALPELMTFVDEHLDPMTVAYFERPLNTDALVKKLYSQEAGLEYVRDLPRDHTLEAITGSGDAFTFLRNHFNGVPC
ncbi:hypothetical protein OIDMADRAFT_35489 [Oidiodendron maius Zn]|uniref:Uncharacterized protein n=1 Tax=Oidiodendron maius (strain Zn) TaxID=913774 RepID=A0A0C3CVE6_OIDMZ|nr:hypothetical protein OIDMADRAFT_35489 [Oidiodendron maius Zn]